MIGWIINKALSEVSWKTFAVGAATAVVGGAVAKPALVSMVAAGLSIPAAVGDVMAQAQEERKKMDAARNAGSNTDVLAAIQQLREELASVKTQLASAKAN